MLSTFCPTGTPAGTEPKERIISHENSRPLPTTTHGSQLRLRLESGSGSAGDAAATAAARAARRRAALTSWTGSALAERGRSLVLRPPVGRPGAGGIGELRRSSMPPG